jgi:hypothetical protein
MGRKRIMLKLTSDLPKVGDRVGYLENMCRNPNPLFLPEDIGVITRIVSDNEYEVKFPKEDKDIFHLKQLVLIEDK